MSLDRIDSHPFVFRLLLAIVSLWVVAPRVCAEFHLAANLNGFVVYCPVPQADNNGHPTRPHIYLREVPSGKTTSLLTDFTSLPFLVIGSVSMDSTGRYLRIIGYAQRAGRSPTLSEIWDSIGGPGYQWWGEWMLDLQTREFVRPPAPLNNPFLQRNSFDWCRGDPVCVISLGGERHPTYYVWDVSRNTARILERNISPDHDLLLGCMPSSQVWGIWSNDRLTIHATGRSNWKETWHLQKKRDEFVLATAITSNGDSAAISTGTRLVLAHKNGEVKVYYIDGVTQPLWAGDGKRMALTTRFDPDPLGALREQVYDILILNVKTGSRQRVVSETATGDNNQFLLAWSKDGRRLILYKQQNGPKPGQYFWAYDIATKKEIPLWHADQELQSFAWHEGPPPSPLP